MNIKYCFLDAAECMWKDIRHALFSQLQSAEGESGQVASLREVVSSLQQEKQGLLGQLDDKTRQLEDLSFRLEEETCNAQDLEVWGMFVHMSRIKA